MIALYHGYLIDKKMGQRGGRTKTTWNPTWKHGVTRTIRVPVVLADQIVAIARAMDEGRLHEALLKDWADNPDKSLDTRNTTS